MAQKETKLDKLMGGLFLMSIFTTVWTILAEFYFKNADSRILGIAFGLIIIYFIYSFWNFTVKRANLPETKEDTDPKRERLFWIILTTEGVAILVAKNVLVNIGQDQLFIASLALIVGLHFIPLAKVFKRKFDYYIGSWTIVCAITGIVLILQKQYDYHTVNAFVCTACAFSTSVYGLNMISNGKKILAAKD